MGLGVTVGDGVGLDVAVGFGLGVFVAVGTRAAAGGAVGVGALGSGAGVKVGAGLASASELNAVAVAVGSGAEPHAAASRARSANSHARAFVGAHGGSCRMDRAIAKVRVGSTIPEALCPSHLARPPRLGPTVSRQLQRKAHPMTQTTTDIPKAYDPKATEQRIYAMWMDGGYFTPTIEPDKEPFTIIMPPPNVTGELHMGHALTDALEDLMTRWHRMLGEPTLYLPGTDHAGIATQVVVERMLAGDGISRHELGRQKFVETVWNWVDEYGDRIYEQIKRLGASCDWSRSAFTLDEGPSLAVRTTFVNLYRKGLIYRRERIVNWCPRCATALSDLEVKHARRRRRPLPHPLQPHRWRRRYDRHHEAGDPARRHGGRR